MGGFLRKRKPTQEDLLEAYRTLAKTHHDMTGSQVTDVVEENAQSLPSGDCWSRPEGGVFKSTEPPPVFGGDTRPLSKSSKDRALAKLETTHQLILRDQPTLMEKLMALVGR